MIAINIPQSAAVLLTLGCWFIIPIFFVSSLTRPRPKLVFDLAMAKVKKKTALRLFFDSLYFLFELRITIEGLTSLTQYWTGCTA